MKKYLVVLLHLGFWGCYLILAMVIVGILYGSNEEVDESKIENAFQIIFFFALVPSAISFYSFYFFLFPKYLKQKRPLPAILYGILISFVAAIIGYACLNGMFAGNCVENEEEGILIGIIIFGAFVAMVAGIIAWVIQGFLTWFEEIQLKEGLKQKNQEMELALVKAQMDPHFLFNTINNIDVLILRDPEEASNYLNQLCDMMRFMLYETKTEEIPLSKEIEYIEKYIALQKIRTANESYVHFSVEGEPKGKSIAPMIFIPFIENAFKHNNNKKIENAIDIQIKIEAEKVTLYCHNKFDPTRKSTDGNNGLGNELIQKRLNLIYPSEHELSIDHQSNQYNISLALERSNA